MQKIKIFTDSCADLGGDIRAKYDIGLVKMRTVAVLYADAVKIARCDKHGGRRIGRVSYTVYRYFTIKRLIDQNLIVRVAVNGVA